MDQGDRSKGESLSRQDREFWDANSGVLYAPWEVDRVASAAAAAMTEASALSVDDVAALLHIDPSVVRHHVTDRKLYAYQAGSSLLFPAWQFVDAGDKVIPSIGAFLAVVPADLHPQAVAGFFLTPTPDLVLDGAPVSAKAWLEANEPVSEVVALAGGLDAGF
jgi:hypothetical protein